MGSPCTLECTKSSIAVEYKYEHTVQHVHWFFSNNNAYIYQNNDFLKSLRNFCTFLSYMMEGFQPNVMAVSEKLAKCSENKIVLLDQKYVEYFLIDK